MNMEYIHQFLVLAQHLNYSVAADKLFLSQSSLSRHISQLEQEYRTVFFVRNTRNVELTPSGEIAVRSFKQIIAKDKELREYIDQEKSKVSGSIRIGFMYHCSPCFHMLLSRFQKKYPDVLMSLKSAKPEILYEDFRSGKLDVVQLMDNAVLQAEPYRVTPFQECPLMVMMREDNPLAGKERLVAQDLAQETNITLGANDFLTDFLRRLDFHFKAEIPSDNMDIIAMKIQETGGIYITALCFHQLIMPGILSRPLTGKNMIYRMSIGSLPNTDNRVVACFIQEAREFLGQERR